MPPEEIEEARAWLTKAVRDLEAAEYLARADEPLLDIVAYHCQQAMEKALKGYLTLRSSPFAQIHALVPWSNRQLSSTATFGTCSNTRRISVPSQRGFGIRES